MKQKQTTDIENKLMITRGERDRERNKLFRSMGFTDTNYYT